MCHRQIRIRDSVQTHFHYRNGGKVDVVRKLFCITLRAPAKDF